VAGILERRGIQAEVPVVSNPEFLREGNALFDMFYADRIVVGADSEAAVATLHELYRPLLEGAFSPPPVLPAQPDGGPPAWVVTPPESAELIKYASNAFLAVKISFINEVALLCERVGADVVEVAHGLGLDHRIGSAFLRAGLGWGGSCFPKDTLGLLALGREHGLDLPVLRGAVEVNHRQREALLDKLAAALGGVSGQTIGLLGLAFKPGTDDVREAPALELARRLLAAGAQVRVHDPQALGTFREAAPGLAVEYCPTALDCATGADALVLVTDWPEYRQADWGALAAAMRGTVVLDGRNHLDRAALAQVGLQVLGIGR
jgi:UDPglucose 6-dehydrogenase